MEGYGGEPRPGVILLTFPAVSPFYMDVGERPGGDRRGSRLTRWQQRQQVGRSFSGLLPLVFPVFFRNSKIHMISRWCQVKARENLSCRLALSNSRGCQLDQLCSAQAVQSSRVALGRAFIIFSPEQWT